MTEVTTFASLPSIVRRLFDQVYAFLRSQTEITQTGHNILLYLDSRPFVVARVEVSGVFAPAGRVAVPGVVAPRAACAGSATLLG